MADNVGIRLGVEGEKDFKRAIADINKDFKVLGSELKRVTSEFEKNDNSVEALTARNDVLNKQIDTQKEKIKILKAALENAADTYGETDNRTKNWQIQLNNAEAALNELDRELKTNILEIENAEAAIDDTSDDSVILANQIKALDSTFELLGSEMKLVTSQFEKNDNSVEALTARNNVLNRQIDTQKEKIELLRASLDNSAELYGENDRRTQSWQVQLNNAEASLNDMRRELDNNVNELKKAENATLDETDAINDLGDESDHSSGKLKALGGALEGIAAASAAAVAAVGAMFVKFSSEVVGAYADYEQLVGGVETLFDSSADKVQEYARDAYKTAGLSANEYMETVTAFSASLIQSLGGDTEKAAEMADMAITDMSDNANKMGSDMSSIQNAYQGFAKQNYTMLDNLRLGYGGTQAEMYRLMSDAAALNSEFAKTANFDLDEKGHLTAGYADIVQAIHIVQTEMGITGTTAKEAEATISGSIATTKSAFQNLVTGFGDANADIDKLCGDIVSSVTNVIKNITPVIKNIVAALPEALEALIDPMMELLSDVVEDIAEDIPDVIGKLLDTTLDVLPRLLSTFFTDVMPKLVKSLMDTLPKLVSGTMQVVKSLITSVAKSLPQLMRDLTKVVVEIVDILTSPDSIKTLIQGGIELVKGLVEGLFTALPELVMAIPEIIGNIVNGIFGFFNSDLEVEGIVDGLSEVGGAFDELSGRAQTAVENVQSKMSDLNAGITTVDDLSTRLKNLIKDGSIDESEQAEVKTIVDLLSEKVPDFETAWSDLVLKDDEGNIALRSSADRTIGKIEEVIAAYKREAAQAALTSGITDLMEQSNQIEIDKEAAQARLNIVQRDYNNWLVDALKESGLSMADWERYVTGQFSTFISGSEEDYKYRKLDSIYGDLIDNGYIKTLSEAQVALNSLENEQRRLNATSEEYEDIMKVMHGDYSSNYAATLKAIELGYVDQNKALGSLQMSMQGLREKAEETSSGVNESVTDAWKNMQSALEQGYIDWDTWEKKTVLTVGNHKYTLGELKNMTKAEFDDLSTYFNTTNWLEWGDETEKVGDHVSEALGSTVGFIEDTLDIASGNINTTTKGMTKSIEGITGNVDKEQMGRDKAGIISSLIPTDEDLKTVYDANKGLGISSLEGLEEGLNNKVVRDRLNNKVRNLALEVGQTYAITNEIKSPSRRFKRFAIHDIEGLIAGHDEMRNEAIASVQRIADDLKTVDFSLPSLSMSDISASVYTASVGASAPAAAPININVQFTGDVSLASDMDIYDVAHQVSDIIASDVIAAGRKF